MGERNVKVRSPTSQNCNMGDVCRGILETEDDFMNEHISKYIAGNSDFGQPKLYDLMERGEIKVNHKELTDCRKRLALA